MTGKERLTRLFNGEDIDRVPVWLLFPYFPSGSYANIWEAPSYQPILRKVYEYTDTIESRHFSTGFCFNLHPDIKHEQSNFKNNESTISQRTVRYKNLKLQSSITKGAKETLIKSLVRDPNDLSKILSMPYQKPEPELSRFFEEQREFGYRGLMAADIGDPLSALHGLCGETDLVLLCYEKFEKVSNFLDVISAPEINERVVRNYLWIIETALENGTY